MNENKNTRALLSSRIGFLLIAAGCAIGLGNVWRFPYITGQNGGALFVIIYFLCLIALGIPCVMIELAVGRNAKQSVAKSFDVIERKGSFWHLAKYPMILASYVLLSYYTVIVGWLLYYVYSLGSGDFVAIKENVLSSGVEDSKVLGLIKDGVGAKFGELINNPTLMTILTWIVAGSALLICLRGVKNGVEKITKPLMILLLLMMVFLAVYALTLNGASEGLSYYLNPDFSKVGTVGIFKVIFEALNQAFFSLGTGVGSLLIFGSYIKKENSLVNESSIIAGLDSFVAIVAGLIIFPICFSFGIEPESGPTLLFSSMLSVFSYMEYGKYVGTFFFIFMFLAAFTTVIALMENIVACVMELFNLSRKVSVFINLILVFLIILPCVLGFNEWSSFMPFGEGSNVLDLEDFILSNNLVPCGALFFVIFCIFGWGFKNTLSEINEGSGLKLPKFFKYYMMVILPIIIAVIFINGYISKFAL